MGTVTGGGARPSINISGSIRGYRPSSSVASTGASSGGTNSSSSTMDFTDFIVTPYDMDVYEGDEVTGSLGIVGAEIDTREWYEKLWDGVKSTGATFVEGVTMFTIGAIDVIDSVVDGGAYLVAGGLDLVGWDSGAKAVRGYISYDWGDGLENAAFGENGVLKSVDDASFFKHDSDQMQFVRKAGYETTKFAAETALTVFTGGAGAAAFGALEGLGQSAENMYQEKGTDLSTGDNLRIIGSGVAGAVSGYFNGQMGVNALSGLKNIGGASVKEFAVNTWRGITNFDFGSAGKAALQTVGSGKTWGTALGTSAGEIFDATANWVDTGEFNIKDWEAVGEHVILSIGFQTLMAAGSSGIANGNARYQQQQAQEAAERAEFNRNMNDMKPDERGKAWEDYFKEQYGAENVSHTDGYVNYYGKSYDGMREICEKYGMTEYEYLQLSRTPINNIPEAQRDAVVKIRMELTSGVTDADGHLLPGTKIAKSVGGDTQFNVGDQAQLTGCVALSDDVMACPDAESIVDATGLRYTDNPFEVTPGTPSDGVKPFYVVEGEVAPTPDGSAPSARVRLSSTADYVPSADGSQTAIDAANQKWGDNAEAGRAGLANSSGMDPKDIFVEYPPSYNRPFPGTEPAGYNPANGLNPDTGTGITLHQGSDSSFGLPEFKSGYKQSVDIVNGTIYEIIGDKKIPKFSIDGDGIITPYTPPTN